MSAIADSKKATDKQYWARDSKNNPSGPGPWGVRENIFHLFCSSASGKYNLSIQIEFVANLLEDRWHHKNMKRFRYFHECGSARYKIPAAVKPVLNV